MGFKTKRQIQGRKVWLARVSKQKELQIKAGLLSVGQDPLPESTTVHNLTGPLLEVLKEEDPLPLVPPVTRQPLSEVLLVIEEPKPEPTNPTGADPIPEVSLFCSLCLRPCASDQVVEFSTEPSWNCLDVASGRDKLALLLGVEMELEQCAVCRSCWTMVETFGDFREGCLKAVAWRARFSFGLDGVGDDWLSKDQVEAMGWTRKVVQEHAERIEIAEVEARNRQDSGANELPEEKPVLEDEQDWGAEEANRPDSPEERPSETAEIVEKMEIIGFSCAKCKRKFETKAGASIHFEYCKKPPRKKPLAAKLHTCSVCSANFTQAYRLEEHLNRHSGIKPYVCRKGICNKPMYGNCQRRKHEKMCKGVNSSNPNVEQDTPEAFDVDITSLNKQQEKTIYSCENCPRRFDTQGGLKNHASRCNERVERRKFHTCEICSMEFLCPQTLEAHMNKHNGIKPYKCKNESCGKHFYGKGELYRHNMLCGKDKPICPLCGVQLSSKGTLKAHMETHAEEPVAGCDTCGKKFKSTKSLKRHQAVHSDERNYPCGVCGKALKSANALYVHRRIHTQEKPYSCTVCGQRFAYKCLVKPHVKKCHAEEG
uniref:Zinc finger protein 728 n=1 Tax=Culex pipiens TaxID=7175 RepID=A0A8D8N7D7_CULPI